MSDEDREKWDARYRDGSYRARSWPSELLEEWAPRLPRGRALDVACGAGRNAIYLATQGFRVDAVDVSGVALERGRAEAQRAGVDVDFRRTDLDAGLEVEGGYALVLVSRFLERSLMPALSSALGEGGFLLYDHHLQTHADVGGPRSDTFRLAPNELLKLFAELRVVYYREGLFPDRDGRTMALAHFVACRGDPGF